MELDALESSHAISVPVNHPNEISEIFDQISYEKGKSLRNGLLLQSLSIFSIGASLIRMLAETIGCETFQKGIIHYLKSK